jgi:trigger factor
MADAAVTSAEQKYEVQVEDVGPAKKRLTITAPADLVDEKLDESMATLATQTALPGFRKGRAPQRLLERRFGTAVRGETKNQLIADAYSTALEQEGIKPVGEPEPVGSVEDIELEAGKPLTFSLDVEIVPEFDLPELANIEVKKPVFDIGDEHIDAEIQRQARQHGEPTEIKGDFQKNDRLLGPGYAKKDDEDEPFFTHDNIDVIMPGDEDDGRGHVLGLLIDGLHAQLKDKKVGDIIELVTVGPESHELEHIRGEKLSIQVTIREAHRVIPATTEQLIEKFGMPSEEILREQVKLALEQRRDQEQRSAMRQQVYDHLIEVIDFDLPEKLSAAQTARMIERQRYEMLQRGVQPEEIEERLAEMRAETEEQSRSRLKLSFVLNRLADHFEVDVSEQEINGRIASIAMQRGVRPEQLRNELAQSGAINQIAMQVREHKAADRVIDQATVTEIPAEEWNKLVEEQSGSSRGSKKKTTKKKTKKTSKKTSSKKKTTTSKKKTSSKKSSSDEEE